MPAAGIAAVPAGMPGVPTAGLAAVPAGVPGVPAAGLAAGPAAGPASGPAGVPGVPAAVLADVVVSRKKPFSDSHQDVGNVSLREAPTGVHAAVPAAVPVAGLAAVPAAVPVAVLAGVASRETSISTNLTPRDINFSVSSWYNLCAPS